MTAFYSEFDPKAAAWLRELIKQGHIADGVVDERDLWDVAPADLAGFTQVHLCAGIGVWSYALRRAGWSDDRPCWTGSFPCQPFSAAGKGAGFADERHLWPAGQYLIEQCRPRTLFGEQVASKDAEPWLDAVQFDLEAMGYAFGACAFPSASIGAPHIRDRTYWVADATGSGRQQQPDAGPAGVFRGETSSGEQVQQPGTDCSGTGGLGHTERLSTGRDTGTGDSAESRDGREPGSDDAGSPGAVRGLADTEHAERRSVGLDGQDEYHRHDNGRPEAHGLAGTRGEIRGWTSPTNGLWRAADWLLCRDGKWRPVEPGTFPLAHGAPARVGRLRGYGNAINAEAAVAWIESYLEAIGERAYVGGAEETPAVRA